MMNYKNKLLYLLFREHKTLLKGVLAGFVLLTAYLLFAYKPSYKTEVDLYIKNIPRNDIITIYNKSDVIQSQTGLSNPLYNLMKILKSPRLSSGMYDYLEENHPKGLKKYGVKNKNKFISKFPKDIKATIQPSTDILKVSFKWVEKDKTIEVFNTIINEFKNINLEIRKTGESKQREYLNKQIAELGRQLDDVRNEIKNYKIENGILEAKNEGIELAKVRIGLEKEIELLKSQLSSNERKIEELTSQLDIPDAKSAIKAASIGEDPYLVKLNQNLASTEQKLANLTAEFTDEYPAVIRIKGELEQIRVNINKRIKETLNDFEVEKGIYDSSSIIIVNNLAKAQSDKVSIKAKLEKLTESIEELRKKEAELPKKIAGLEVLQKNEQALADAYLKGSQKLMEASLKENQLVDNIFPLGNPKKPSFDLIELLIKSMSILMLGFLGAFSYIWVKDDIEDKWFDSSEIEKLTGRKVLGIIPWIRRYDTHQEENKAILDLAYKNIANSIINRSYKEDAQVLSFISSSCSKRKSSITSKIFENIITTGTSAVLLDTDFGPGRYEKDYGESSQKPEVDIIDTLREINKYLRMSESVDENLICGLIDRSMVKVTVTGDNGIESSCDYIYSEKSVDDIYDFVSTPGFRVIIAYLKKKYELVFIDIPAKPVFFPEIENITGISDAVIILSAMETNKEELIKIVNKFSESDKKILGIISRQEDTEAEKYFIPPEKNKKPEWKILNSMRDKINERYSS